MIVALNSAVAYPGNCITIVSLYFSSDILRVKPIGFGLFQIYRTVFCHRTIKKEISGL